MSLFNIYYIKIQYIHVGTKYNMCNTIIMMLRNKDLTVQFGLVYDDIRNLL